MVEAATAPVGWARDVACVIRHGDGHPVLGENGKVREQERKRARQRQIETGTETKKETETETESLSAVTPENRQAGILHVACCMQQPKNGPPAVCARGTQE